MPLLCISPHRLVLAVKTFTSPYPLYSEPVHFSPPPVRTSPTRTIARQPPLPGPVLALGSMAVTIKGISPSGLITTRPAPAFQACRSLFLRRRAHPAAPVSTLATQMMQDCTFHLLGSFPQPHLFSPGLLSLLNLVRKPSTLNGHAPYFQKWQAFCCARGIPYLPAAPLAVANFLFESSAGDNTASPTLNRCGAISFFCHMAGTPNPMAHPLCVQVKSALLRTLGLMGAKKLPLLQSQLLHIFHIQLSAPHTLPTLLHCFHMALMYEGCLRWHDLAQLFFGDIIITKCCLSNLPKQTLIARANGLLLLPPQLHTPFVNSFIESWIIFPAFGLWPLSHPVQGCLLPLLP